MSPARRERRTRTTNARFHALVAGAKYAEYIDPFEIFSRDHWRCKRCGHETPPHLRGTCDSCAPTLDHIIPLSLGGPHVRRNLRCLCNECNNARGAEYQGQLAFC